MPGSSAQRFSAGLPIGSLIARELAGNPELKDGYSAYATMLAAYRKSGDARRLLRKLLDHAARLYRATAGIEAELLTFDDDGVGFLFDLATDRTVLVWGVSRAVAANSRDNAYHGGFPRAGDGLDKGHAWSHAQGGREGGPNYFRQARRLNQARSRNGKLWRAIESFLAATPGTRAFVRLIYAPGNATDVPREVEYGLLGGGGQFRVVIFPNSSAPLWWVSAR